MDAVLAFDPESAIEFVISEGTARASLAVTNTSSEHHAVLKVKTNAADRYVVKPHVALLKPSETRTIQLSVQVNQLSSFRTDMERQFAEHRAQTAFLMLGWVLPAELVSQLDAVAADLGERELISTLGTMWKSREAEDKATGVATFEQKKFSAIARGLDPTVAAFTAAALSQHQQSDRNSSSSQPSESSLAAAAATQAEDGAAPGEGAAAEEEAAPQRPPGMSAEDAYKLRNKYQELSAYVLQIVGERDSLGKSVVKRERDLEDLRSRLDETKQQLLAAESAAEEARAVAADGARQRKGDAVKAAKKEAASGGAMAADAAPTAATGFRLWQVLLIALLAFFIGFVARGMGEAASGGE